MTNPGLQNYFAESRQRRVAREWAARAESDLSANFSSWVAELDLGSLIAKSQKPPRKLGRYALIPLVAVDNTRGSGMAAGNEIIVPDGVFVEPSSHEPLFLDTGVAIGLTHDNILRAVSGAYVSNLAEIVIEQNQGLVESHPELGRDNPALRSGLHGGFHWEDALDQGWLAIGEKLEAPRARITGSTNNRYTSKLGLQGQKPPEDMHDPRWDEIRQVGAAMLKPHYDDVADRLGFTPLPNGDWTLDLAAIEQA